MEFLFVVILFSGICAFLGYAVMPEPQKATGAILGALLGPIGVVIALLSSLAKK